MDCPAVQTNPLLEKPEQPRFEALSHWPISRSKHFAKGSHGHSVSTPLGQKNVLQSGTIIMAKFLYSASAPAAPSVDSNWYGNLSEMFSHTYLCPEQRAFGFYRLFFEDLSRRPKAKKHTPPKKPKKLNICETFCCFYN